MKRKILHLLLAPAIVPPLLASGMVGALSKKSRIVYRYRHSFPMFISVACVVALICMKQSLGVVFGCALFVVSATIHNRCAKVYRRFSEAEAKSLWRQLTRSRVKDREAAFVEMRSQNDMTSMQNADCALYNGGLWWWYGWTMLLDASLLVWTIVVAM